MKNQIKNAIQSAIKKLYPDHWDTVFSVDYPPAGVDADFASNIAMVLAKKIGKPPMDVAEEISGKLKVESKKLEGRGKADLFEITVAKPGFLNFKLTRRALTENLNTIISKPSSYGAVDLGQGKPAIVEYFQLNIAKLPHVGHLRSAVIGDSLKRILKFSGYKVISDTHVGDWGTQVGSMICAYKNERDKGVSEAKFEPSVAEYTKLYAEQNKLIEKEPWRRDNAKKEFVKLERGDTENRKIWESMRKLSTQELESYVQRLGLLSFDYNLGESFYEGKMPVILKRLEKADLLVIGETGEKYVDLEKYGLGRLICVKSDGGTTYEMRDLATLAYRYDELAKEQMSELAWNLYVVDTRQAHDFKQVFKTMELLGYDISKSKHVDFGFMSLPEGAISTRKGNAISLETLVEEAKKRALEIIKQKNPDLKNKEQVAEQVALAAIKYGDLKHNRKSDIVFDWDTALSFEGDTGPYLQYTYARLCSILRKVGERLGKNLDEVLIGQAEVAMLRKLALFPDKITDAAIEFLPSILAEYLFELAGVANGFYQSSPVMQEKDKKVRSLRLALVAAAVSVLKIGLGLLGIEAPEEM
jgi:arginyl-tRNA synthetase